jgi:hypothetical protein
MSDATSPVVIDVTCHVQQVPRFGCKGGSLFVRAREPGAPTRVFADEDSADYPERELVEEMKRRELEEG